MTEHKLSESFAAPDPVTHPSYVPVSKPEVEHNGQPINVDALLYVHNLEQENIRLRNIRSNQRKELRRLNVKEQHLMTQNYALQLENMALVALLEREEDENKNDTDPSQLVPVQEDSFPTQEAKVSRRDETYEEWDFRTRYGSGGPRK